VVVKIDIPKVFDNFNWHFLVQVLERFGYHVTFSSWIFYILKSFSFSKSEWKIGLLFLLWERC